MQSNNKIIGLEIRKLSDFSGFLNVSASAILNRKLTDQQNPNKFNLDNPLLIWKR